MGNDDNDPMMGLRYAENFVVVSRLAVGGMGALYLASHERLPNTHKVIKTLLPEFAGIGVLRERFYSEATAVARLEHTNIVTVENLVTLPSGQLYIVMPFLKGQSLDRYLGAGLK